MGTVYRNLELLIEFGIIQKLDYGSGQKLYDGNPEPHAHFRCTKCIKVEDIPLKIKTQILDSNHEWIKKRVISGSRLEYYGLCPDCAVSKK